MAVGIKNLTTDTAGTEEEVAEHLRPCCIWRLMDRARVRVIETKGVMGLKGHLQP